ncbi:MAG TPA: peptide ABC transporter substrate-binding protein, partial [Gemmatimonadales bacterium]|nr:peptide ABC transporter substrate-binding protein [Gemmatimonadales bacterium]
AASEPDILLPPMTDNTLARDISDQIFLKLADIGMSLNTVGDTDFQPLLAQRWEWDDPLTLVFHLDPRARWHDGTPVTAADVAFTFDAYTAPETGSPYRTVLSRIRAVTARDSLTAVFRFRERYPEMFYDAVYHMRILPAHLLHVVPRNRWATAEFGRRPVGNGPYRFVDWRASEHIELVADSGFFLGRPHIARLIWRVTADMPAAVNLLLAGEADAIEFLITPELLRRVREAPHLATYPYPASTYTYLAFNFRAYGDTSRPHPLFADRDVRRALFMATDRERLLQSVLGDLAKVPPAPIPQMWWLWQLDARPLPFDSAGAGRLLDRRGWRDTDGDGVRDKDGAKLSFRLAVPTTSAVRRRYAQLLQAQYRPHGVEVRIEELEPTVLQERAAAGQFDAALASWVTDPTPTSSFPQTWSSAGAGGSNWSRYANPEFDRLVARAAAAPAPQNRRLWEAVLRLLNDDAAGIWLYAINNIAAVHSRVADVRIRPDSWWALVRTWRIPPDRLIDRDRARR